MSAKPRIDHDRLRALHADGLDDGQIAESLGASRRWVRRLRVRLRLAARGRGGRPRLGDDRVRELHAQGLSDGQIAAAMGATRTGVQCVRRRLGLEANFEVGMRRATIIDAARAGEGTQS